MKRQPVQPNVDFLDVNVWIALSLEDHPHHPRAHHYWHHESRPHIAFCRQTSLALVRLLTQPAVTNGRPMTLPEAWQNYQAFRGLPEVVLLEESRKIESILGAWASSDTARPRLWTDAYLAAFAKAGTLRMVSFDNDFSRFTDLDLLRLEA